MKNQPFSVSRKNLFQKYRSRFFYIRLSILALIAAIIIVAIFSDGYPNPGQGGLSSSAAAIFGGVAIWFVIVTFPKPFSEKNSSSKDSMRQRLLEERIKTTFLILILTSILFSLHMRSTPPFPKIGIAFLLAGFTWANIIMWPDIRKNWREDICRWKTKGWKGWRWW